jgi:hypothetical protein
MKRLSKQLLWGFGALAACDGDHGTVDLRTQEVTAVCVTSGAGAPADAWFCPTPLTVQCGSSVPPLYVENVAGCEQSSLSVSDVLLGQSGVQSVEVRRPDGGLACATTLTVLDSAGPVLTPQVINIWPPNHKFHTISVEDCVGAYDACDPSVTAEFVWASSDEPVDDFGDGHHAPDILLDGCDRVQVRSERQGPKNGRVYKLGVRATDGAGNVTLGECAVIVDHDQRGVVGADSGESYRVLFDGSAGLPRCDGTPDDVPPPAVPPPVKVDAGTPTVGI